MFICDVTGEVSNPGEPMTKVVVETRNREYRNLVVEDSDNPFSKKVEKISHGWEIVKELKVSPKGMELLRIEKKQ